MAKDLPLYNINTLRIHTHTQKREVGRKIRFNSKRNIQFINFQSIAFPFHNTNYFSYAQS